MGPRSAGRSILPRRRNMVARVGALLGYLRSAIPYLKEFCEAGAADISAKSFGRNFDCRVETILFHLLTQLCLGGANFMSRRHLALEYLPRVTIYIVAKKTIYAVAKNVGRERGYEVHSKGNGHAKLHCGGSSDVDCRVRIRADAAHSTVCVCDDPDDTICLRHRRYQSLLSLCVIQSHQPLLHGYRVSVLLCD